MRVLHVIPSLDPRGGGPPMALAGLVSAQAQAGLAVSVAATWGGDDNPDLAVSLRTRGVAVELIGPCHGKLRRHPDIAAVLRRMVGQADVIHIHALWEEIQHQAAIAAQRAGKPYIITPHGMLDPWCLAQSKWIKRLYMAWRLRRNLKAATALHFTAQIERDLLRPLGFSNRTILEPNGIDLSEFDPPPPAGRFRARYPQIGQRPIVLFLSRLHPKKGLDLLIPAFARCARGDAVLVIAGPPASTDYQAELEGLVAANGITDVTVFTGMLHGADRIAAFVDAHLFVLPSYQENFGIVVVESLAAGTPVIISDQVNIHPEITQAQVGAVVPTQIPPIADELSRWINNASLREATAQRAREFAFQCYDWDKISCHWIEHYRKVMETTR